MPANADDVASHYDAFPYPSVSSLALPRPAGWTRHRLSYLLGRRGPGWLNAAPRIWVAGCGTQQGVFWAKCFPEAEVVATDLSNVSLDIARGLASQLGAANVRFEQHDLMRGGLAGPFDVIVSTGVLHHLPEPETGLRHLRSALGDDGVMQLMVYSRMHREPLANFRRALELVAPQSQPPDRRYALACALLESLLGSERCSPPCPGALQELFERRESDRPFVADALLHPLEQSYDLDGLFAFLRGSGLRHASWVHPAQWDVSSYLDSPELARAYASLDAEGRYRAAYHLAGYAGPLFELLACPTRQPVPVPYGDDELRAMRVTSSAGRAVHVVEHGQVVRSGQVAAFEEEGDEITGRGEGSFGVRERWRLPAHARRVFEAADGTRTVAELQAHLDDDFAPDDVLALVRAFLPDRLGLLVVHPP